MDQVNVELTLKGTGQLITTDTGQERGGQSMCTNDTHRILDRRYQIFPDEYGRSGIFMALSQTNSYAPEMGKVM
jgi:hypothetical protein